MAEAKRKKRRDSLTSQSPKRTAGCNFLSTDFGDDCRAEKNSFFLLHEPPPFSQNRRKRRLEGCRPDIALAGPVQNILKKVKKRLVSPLKPR